MPPNLYVHFPFCRAKCSYCVLHSRAGRPQAEADAYASRIAAEIARLAADAAHPLSTIYFGGGSPALCDLRPVLGALTPLVGGETEFTVELHPLDATDDTLSMLHDGGVNRISMGVQSLDDRILADMRRVHTADDARRAFGRIRRKFDNAGIDLIAGYPAEGGDRSDYESLASWGIAHCSLYSLILEERSILASRIKRGSSAAPPGDDETMDELSRIGGILESAGLERYEISSYAKPGFECRHNLATWLGEDYAGLGDGAYGREGLRRTFNPEDGGPCEETVLSAPADRKERRLFALRTRFGLDATDNPEWVDALERNAAEGLLEKTAALRYRLTERGCEVCDAILAELV